MPHVRLKGLNSRRKRLADGRVVTYWWAWKGGPRLEGEPGSPEFMASYNAAVAARRTPTGKTLADLVALYKASPEWAKNSETTKRQWMRWLDRIVVDVGPKDIGGLSYRMLDDRRVRADLLDWRDQYAAHPRQADYAMQVLSAVLGWGASRGLLALNAAAGTAQLYESNRADQIWTAGEIAAFTAAAPSPEVGFIVRLAAVTGLRREDLARLAWSHVGDLAIVMTTGKSRGRKTVTIPLIKESRQLLADIAAQQAVRHQLLTHLAVKKKRPAPPEPLTVLTNTRGLPWSVNGLEHQVIDTKARAGVDKHLHDARGTFATRLRLAGLNAAQIADVLGWEEDRVKRLLAIYVDQDAVVMALARQIEKSERNN